MQALLLSGFRGKEKKGDFDDCVLSGYRRVFILYEFLLIALLATLGPFLLLSKKARAGVMEKLGFISRSKRKKIDRLPAVKPRILFHAVSVGEFNAVLPLIEEFRRRHPEYQIFISTTTRTGQELARTRASGFAEIFYFPLDLPWAVASFLDLLRPELVGIVETEIWPFFMESCRRRQIEVVLLNGRLSPRSFEGYRKWRWFFAPVVSRFSALAVQSEAEKERFISIGADAASVKVCGNIKLDGLKPVSDQESKEIRHRLNLSRGEAVVVAGSTHEGEESVFLSALKELRGRFRLIIVPRHPERFDRVAQLIEEMGFKTKRFSLNESFQESDDIFLLDTIGQLNRFYSIADIAFVGGTLADIGGHNLAEPCASRVPVVCGPHVHKARDLFQKLSDCRAICKVNDANELKSVLCLLLDSADRREQLGENGYRFLLESQGALEKTLEVLEKQLRRESMPSPLKNAGATAGRALR